MPGSLTKMFGLLFFAIYFLYHNTLVSKRSFPNPPKAIWWFVGYLAVYTISGIFLPEEMLGGYLSRLFTLLQLILFFWIACDLLKGKMARNACLIFSISSLIVAVGSIVTDDSRATQMGMGTNPDTLAVQMALTILIFTGLYLAPASKGFMSSRLSLVGLTFPLLTLMLKAGSRGALVVLVTGYLVYVLPIASVKSRLAAIFVAVAGIAAIVYMAAVSPEYSERWKQTYYEGNVSGRDEIYAASIEMILERPLLGWHPVLHWYELGSRRGGLFLDEHSLILHLFAEVGLIGAIPFFVGLWVCAREAWKARKGALRLLPMALMVATLTSNVTDTYIARKTLWFTLALAVAAASVGLREKVIVFGRTRTD